MKQNNKPSWGEILAFAVGDGGCNLVWTTIGSYLTLYYTDSVGIAAATIGTLMLLSRLLDGHVPDLRRYRDRAAAYHLPGNQRAYQY